MWWGPFVVIVACDGFRGPSDPAGRLVALRAATVERLAAPASAPAKKLDWERQWYPLAVTECLDEKVPTRLELLGRELVAWKSKEGWRVFDNACPHRLAPLSEGRIEEDGSLLCSYHAWRFDEQGECVSMPQAKNQVITANCVPSYPVRHVDGLLWVFADPTDDGRLAAATSTPPIRDEIDDSRVVKPQWNFRDLPYGWDFFCENVMDPAHVSVSHHGITGSRYEADQYFEVRKVAEPTVEGFAFQTFREDSNISAVTEFRAPVLTKITNSLPNDGKLVLYLYATPTKPGFCRHIGCQVLIPGDDGKLPPGLGFFALPMPTWLLHVLASLFLHQDLVFLHHQEKTFALRGYEARSDAGDATKKPSYSSLVFTPTPQDKILLTFRNWLRNKAGGGVPWFGSPDLPPRETDPRKLFDVWHSHTSKCRICRAALDNVRRVRFAAAVAAGIVAVATRDALHACLGAGFFGLVALLAHKLVGLFHAYEFSHAKNN